MSEEIPFSSWNAAMIAAAADRLSTKGKDLLIQWLRLRAEVLQIEQEQLEQMVAQAKEEGMPDDLSGSLGKAKEDSMLIIRTLTEAERLVREGSPQ